MINKTIAAESEINKTHYSAKDSLIDRYCNRKISALITRIIAKTPITANHVTIFNFFVGVFALLFFLKGDYYNLIIGSLIYQFNTVLDHCDGEIARLKKQSSRFGFWLDIITDAFTGITVVICIGFGLSAGLNDRSYIIWGFVAALGMLISSFFVFYNASKRKGAENTICFAVGENGSPPTALEIFVDNTLNKNLSLYILIGALIGKLDMLLIIASIGAQVHWILILIVVCKKRRLTLKWLKN